MNFNHLKEKKEVVSIALLGISTLFAVLILIKLAGFFITNARAKNLVKNAIEQNKTSSKDVDKVFAESKIIVDKLKKENLFAPPPPKQQPIKEVWGILGDEVLINNKWYKVGDTIQDAKIVAIDCTEIRIEWDGKEVTLAPIDAKSSSPSGSKPKQPEVAKGDKGEGAEMVVVQPEQGPMPGRRDSGAAARLPSGDGAISGGGAGRMMGLSEEDRERLRAEIMARREEFMKMSPEERRQFIERMRGGSGGGTGGGRGGTR